jgi:hypothetical protein
LNGIERPRDFGRPSTALLRQLAVDDEQGAIQWLPIARDTLGKVAAVYAALPAVVFLRAADALHLATAAQHGFGSVCSNDGHLLAAAPHFGLAGRNVIAAVP